MGGAASGPEFDGRFDPRFQRGWVEGEADGAAPAERAPVDAGPANPAAPVHPVNPADPVERVESREPTIAAEAEESAEHPESSELVAPATSAPPLAVAAPSDVDPPTGLDSTRILRSSLGVAWAIAVVATLTGVGLVWSLAGSADPFMTPRDPTELVIRTLAQFAAPALLSTGLLGIVVLTVVDGLRRARRVDAPPTRVDRGDA